MDTDKRAKAVVADLREPGSLLGLSRPATKKGGAAAPYIPVARIRIPGLFYFTLIWISHFEMRVGTRGLQIALGCRCPLYCSMD